jgi:hypothetical protein
MNDDKGPLFRAVGRGTGQLPRTLLPRGAPKDALRQQQPDKLSQKLPKSAIKWLGPRKPLHQPRLETMLCGCVLLCGAPLSVSEALVSCRFPDSNAPGSVASTRAAAAATARSLLRLFFAPLGRPLGGPVAWPMHVCRISFQARSGVIPGISVYISEPSAKSPRAKWVLLHSPRLVSAAARIRAQTARLRYRGEPRLACVGSLLVEGWRGSPAVVFDHQGWLPAFDRTTARSGGHPQASAMPNFRSPPDLRGF